MTAARVLTESDVVFMYGSTPAQYRAYGATFCAWGGAKTPESVRRHHEAGVRCTGSMWCLTAGPVHTHDDPDLREACSVDPFGERVRVPWLWDQEYRGEYAYFGCTNTPAFQEWTLGRAREAMSGGADGLHVDDPRGTAGSLQWGGGFCDRCMAGFREYLRSVNPARLREAGVEDVDGFDYRDMVRARASTREEYRTMRSKIPLMDLFEDYHAHAAAAHVRNVAAAGAEAAGHPITLSANAYMMAESFRPIIELDELTHVVCEVPLHAQDGAAKLTEAVAGFRKAAQMGKPAAVTASGHDWAWVKAHDAWNLARIWVALTYACGQRFMVPHPTRQWCFTEEMGTHWLACPAGEFTPMYEFIQAHADRFNGYVDGPDDVEHPEKVFARVRVRPGSPAVVHAVNLDYVAYDPVTHDRGVLQSQENVTLSAPAELAGSAGRVRLLSPDGEPAVVEAARSGGRVRFTIPGLPVWAVCVME